MPFDMYKIDTVRVDEKYIKKEKERLKPKLAEVKLLFPQKLSEAEPSKTN